MTNSSKWKDMRLNAGTKSAEWCRVPTTIVTVTSDTNIRRTSRKWLLCVSYKIIASFSKKQKFCLKIDLFCVEQNPHPKFLLNSRTESMRIFVVKFTVKSTSRLPHFTFKKYVTIIFSVSLKRLY